MVEFASDERMQAREGLATEFFRVAFGPDGDEHGDYRLAYVSDEANLRDINPTGEDEVIDRVRQHYGVEFGLDDFSLPFWRLLDRLDAERR